VEDRISPSSLAAARDAVLTEAQALEQLAGRLDENFERAVRMLVNCQSHVVISGIGKSGLIGRKVAATLASTGTPAFFVHSGEALHGDAGMVCPKDIVILISNSGETSEVCQFGRVVRAMDVPVIAMAGREGSDLVAIADVWLNIGVDREADPLNLAPTTSTTVTVALGDALASAAMVERGFSPEDFARCHPAGALGRRLLDEGGTR
jgi:arabinose-5-phosphate isomerase